MNAKVATIVTGGGRGIGRAIAERMAAETAVFVVGRTEADLVGLCDVVVKAGGSAAYLVGDVSSPATADAALTKLTANGLSVLNLVCNAGIGTSGAAHTMDKQAWRDMFAVNVNGAMWFIQACLPGMIERKSGSICVISSVAGVKGFKYQTAYCATKHALVGMARSIALEVAKHNIRVVPICPSFVESEMTDRTIAGLVKHRGITAEAARKIVEDTNPQKRIIPASEVADMVALVCAGRVPSLNGNPLMMTGGE
ncbi:MAG: SDR family NAD(P)-dependent oxidoreductase [Candidatus Melainabacteria bacterium]|nr:SDR family NAD(P)-dependent oxidoreductase [Candidatus Melainabacteria bacterium]